jgi:hypothetical protein
MKLVPAELPRWYYGSQEISKRKADVDTCRVMFNQVSQKSINLLTQQLWQEQNDKCNLND